MSFLSQLFARRSSAPVARDRLQILLAHERADGGAGSGAQSELIAKLREEILDVIARHVPIDRDKVQIKLDRGDAVSTLEIDVEMPPLKKGQPATNGGKPAGPVPAPAKKPDPASAEPKPAEAVKAATGKAPADGTPADKAATETSEAAKAPSDKTAADAKAAAP